MIQVKDVVKSFDGNVVLDHISADFEDGKVNMIIGQSGSGKTVLMKNIASFYNLYRRVVRTSIRPRKVLAKVFGTRMPETATRPVSKP